MVRAYDAGRAVATNRISPWSAPWVYVYPTSGRVHASTKRLRWDPEDPRTGDLLTVPDVHTPFDGRNLAYTYHVCTNTLPTRPSTGSYNPTVLTEINNGIDAWDGAGGLLHTTGHTRDCDDAEWKELEGSRNLVVLVSNVDGIGDMCGRPLELYKPGSGCAPIYPTKDTSGQRTGDRRHIVIYKITNFRDTTKGCTSMFRVAMHEAGHALGYHHGIKTT